MPVTVYSAHSRARPSGGSQSATDWDDLCNGNKDQRFDGIFFQRKLKPVERGRCEFFIDEARAHKDLPIAHEFRIHIDLPDITPLRAQLRDRLGSMIISTLKCSYSEILVNPQRIGNA